MLQRQQSDGSFGNHPYSKWTGAHWRLVSLIGLGIPAGHRRALKAIDDVLRWLHRGEHAKSPPKINGLVLRHASIEGNAIAVCVRLGRVRDSEVEALVERLLDSQWPDGGWNCDSNAKGTVSSSYETVTPMWGLSEYARATGDTDARLAAERAAELFLERRLLHGLLLLSRVVG